MPAPVNPAASHASSFASPRLRAQPCDSKWSLMFPDGIGRPSNNLYDTEQIRVG